MKFFQSIQIRLEDIRNLVTWHPQFLTLNIERNLKPTINYLLDLIFTKHELQDMIWRLSSLLEFNITAFLNPDYKYFVDSMKCSQSELVYFPCEWIMNISGLLHSSLIPSQWKKTRMWKVWIMTKKLQTRK